MFLVGAITMIDTRIVKLIMVFLSYVLLLNVSVLNTAKFTDSVQLGRPDGTYHDIIIDNVVVAKGVRLDCDSTYKVIQKILDNYSRPFTMLDIGAALGYFSFRVAHDYDATCVMIEPSTADGLRLLELCKLNQKLDNIILLNTNLDLDQTVRLSECEHFDVILLLNVIHWFGAQWRDIFEAVLKLGDNFIIQTPPASDNWSVNHEKHAEINDYIIAKGGVVIGESLRENPNTGEKLSTPIYLISNHGCTIYERSLVRSHWYKEYDLNILRKYKIYSNWHFKSLKKIDASGENFVSWSKGINLITFKALGGIYPTEQQLLANIDNMKRLFSSDTAINNIILQGNQCKFIDCFDHFTNTAVNKNCAYFKNEIKELLKLSDFNAFLFKQYLEKINV